MEAIRSCLLSQSAEFGFLEQPGYSLVAISAAEAISKRHHLIFGSLRVVIIVAHQYQFHRSIPRGHSAA
jgi:hypothetical protein